MLMVFFCPSCEDGYVGDPVSGQPCEPCLCPDVDGSGRFFAISCNKDPYSGAPNCECLPGHTGPYSRSFIAFPKPSKSLPVTCLM